MLAPTWVPIWFVTNRAEPVLFQKVSEYIVNPRRAPRASSRCAALVHTPESAWKSETEDLSSLGCQLVAPKAMARGFPMTLVLANPKVKGSLRVEGRVAWGSSQPPWRVGVAFGEGSRAEAERWFSTLVATSPGLAGTRRVPDRLPIDAMLYLGPPPTFLVDFSPEEVEVLRHVAGGTTAAELRRALEPGWSGAQRAIFSLLARGVVTVSRSAAGHVSSWKKVLAQLGVEFVAEPPRPVRAEPVPERAASRLASRSGAPEHDRNDAPPPELLEPIPSRPDPGRGGAAADATQAHEGSGDRDGGRAAGALAGRADGRHRLARRRAPPHARGAGVLRPGSHRAGGRAKPQRAGPPAARAAARAGRLGDRNRDRPRHGDALANHPASVRLAAARQTRRRVSDLNCGPDWSNP